MKATVRVQGGSGRKTRREVRTFKTTTSQQRVGAGVGDAERTERRPATSANTTARKVARTVPAVGLAADFAGLASPRPMPPSRLFLAVAYGW